MNCSNLIAMCAKTHHPCPHAQYDGRCEGAECGNDSVPTFRQMCMIYERISPASKRRIRNSIAAVERIVGIAGLTMEDKVTRLGDDEWELVLARMTSGTHPLAMEGGYDLATVACYFVSFRAVCGRTSREFRREYKNRGLVQYDTDIIPPVEVPHKEIEELTKEQVLAIKDKLVMLRQPESDRRKAKANRNLYVWMWFAFYFGVRPADIGRLTWSCIIDDPEGGKRIEYVPSKTERKTGGRPAGCHIHPTLMTLIAPFVGDKDEYVIPRDLRKRSHAPTHGEYVGNHVTLRRRANEFMRSIGVTGHMAAYTMRRDCSRWSIQHEGAMTESQKLGHSVRTALTHYTTLSRLNLAR